jgi:hypothetical protein
MIIFSIIFIILLTIAIAFFEYTKIGRVLITYIIDNLIF